MNKNLTTINNAISEIREIVGAECTHISDLPKMVMQAIDNTNGSGHTMAFAFSSSFSDRPSASTLNIESGFVEDLEEGWSQTSLDGNSEVAMMSFAMFDSSGNRTTDWSDPVNIKGARGADGIAGEVGPQGPQGPKGEKGEVISYRTIFAYSGTETEDAPFKPAGGSWDLSSNKVLPPTSMDGKTVWVLNADEVNETYIWLSQATFNQDGSIINDWCTPIRMSGKDGKNGVDGQTIEFIYRLLPDYETYLELFEHLAKNKLYSPENENGVVPPVNDLLNIGTEWTASPNGISQVFPIEVVCTRYKTEETWSSWTNCVIWSKWGEDGTDGDGVEYIYLVTVPDITSDKVKLSYMPSNLEAISLQEDYQQDGFCFNDEWGFEGYDWTDEPQDVGPGKPLEWVSIRKYIDGKWGVFSNPKLWAKYSEDGITYITSFVFTRASIDNPPSQPTGGSFSRPVPDETIWEDSVPASQDNLPVWMSTRTFASGGYDFDDDWSMPKLLTDSPDFQVEYCADPNVSGDQITKFTGNETEWRQAQPYKWGDESEITDPTWMITASSRGGVWSDWTLTRIKGEKGEKGDAGSSVAIEGQFATKDDLLIAWRKYIENGDVSDFYFESGDNVINQGDGWYVVEEGLLYTYSGGWSSEESNSNFDLYWFSTPIKGEPGDTAYIYIAYTDGTDDTATLYFDTPKKYIGIKYSNVELSDDEKNSYNTYMWSQWKGEDGWGQEQIFLLTSEALGFNPDGEHLPLPTDNQSIQDYLPAHSYGSKAYPTDRWSDTPLTVTEHLPYCWVAIRKRQGDVFENWKGYNNKAALYSRYSYDGVSNVKVDLTNDLAIIPMEHGRIDPDFTDEVSTTVKVYVGDEEVTDFSVFGEKVTIQGSKVILNIEAVDENTKEIPLTVTFSGKSYDVIWNIFQTNTAYELTPNTYVIKRYAEGELSGQLSESKLVVSILKWSNNKWIAANIPVFAEVTYTNNKVEILSTSDGKIEVNNGKAVIDLNGLLNVAGIKIYIVQKNSVGEYWSDGDIISFENISIVADGKTGSNGGRTVFLFTSSDSYVTHSVKTPTGGTWNTETNEVENVVSGDNHIWTMSAPHTTSDAPYVWQTIGNFNAEGQLTGNWSEPICITGAEGQPGADGAPGKNGIGVEFIYRLLRNKSEYDDLVTHLLDKPLPITETGEVPDKNDLICTTDWTDYPTGIEKDIYPIEVSCVRRTDADGNWEKWALPTIWAMWGEDGNDGPGFEYIFKITANDVTAELLEIELVDTKNHIDFQNDGFVPINWNDEPSDVSSKEPFEWVSTRKKINGEWQPFTKPALWGKFTENGYAFKTSYIFTRSIDTPVKPDSTVGDFETPYPTEGIWKDSVPEGNEPIWMCYRAFRSDDIIVDENWSDPARMGDTSDIQVEFTAKDLSGLNYTPSNLNDYVGQEDPESSWREFESTQGVDWADDVPNACYMATAICRNGVWENWSITRIQGEKGEAGENGTSITIKGKFESETALQDEWEKYINSPSSYEGVFVIPMNSGDCYTVGTHLWVYDGLGTEFDDAWIDIGEFHGEPSKLYVRFSPNSDGTEMFAPEEAGNGNVPKYIGIYASTGEADEDTLSNPTTFEPWVKWNGDDGFGMEFKFMATEDYKAPALPTSETESEWSDNLISVSEENPYIWYISRKKSSSETGEWFGENNHAALWDRWTIDGNNAVLFELSQDQIVVPVEVNGTIDSDLTDKNITISLNVYDGSEKASNVTYSNDLNDDNVCEINGDVATIYLAELSNISEIVFTAEYKGSKHEKVCQIKKTTNAYEIGTNVNAVRKNSDGSINETIIVYPKKWNGNKWTSVANGVSLWYKLFTIDDPNGTEAGPISIESSSVDVTINTPNLTKIRFYLKDGDNELCYEEVGVYADGAKGDKGDKGETGDAGRGIVSVTEYYLVTSLSSEVTVDTEGWTKDKPSKDVNSTERYLWNYTKTVYTDGTENSDPIIIGGYGADAISINLSNEFARMAWFANGDVSVDTIECEVTAVKNGTPVDLTCTTDSIAFDVVDIVGNKITIMSNVKLSPGIYVQKIKIVIDGEGVFYKTITITVEEIPNIDTDIIMDQHIELDSETLALLGLINESYIDINAYPYPYYETIEYSVLGNELEAYLRTNIYTSNIRVVSNGVNVDWTVTKVVLGDKELTETWKVTNDRLFFSYNAFRGVTLPCNGKVTFSVGNTSIDKDVIFVKSDSYFKKLIITPTELKQGESTNVTFLVESASQSSNSNRTVSLKELMDSDTSLSLYANETFIELDEAGQYSVDGITDDIEFKLVRDTVTLGLATLRVPVTSKIDYYTLTSLNPFVRVNEGAITNNGVLVGDPIQLVIKHHIGESVDALDTVPEGYYLKVNDVEWSGGLVLGSSDLYKNAESVKIELFANGTLIDSITVEKTVVYPEPIIYPAGVWDSSKSYTMDFNKIPYVSIKGDDSIKYYVGNIDILTKYPIGTINLNGSELAITGTSPVDLKTEEEVLLWKPMESFEAIYADIGVFNQALVGPMVFYKDWVFSQIGTFNAATKEIESVEYTSTELILEEESYTTGSLVEYEEMCAGYISMINSEGTYTTLQYSDVWSYVSDGFWTPTYLLNARTGQLTLCSLSSAPTTLQIGDNLSIGGEDQAIVVTEQLTTEGIDHEGHVYIGHDNYPPLFVGSSVKVYEDEGEDYYVTKAISMSCDSSISCYGGGVLKLTNDDERITDAPRAAKNCLYTTYLPGPSAISINSPAGPSICNLVGGIYGLRTGAKVVTEDMDMSLTCAGLCPQTLFVQNNCTITLPRSELSEIGDFFEIWKGNNITTTLKVGDSESFDICTSQSFSSKTSHAFETPGVYKAIFNGTKWLFMWLGN